MNAQTEETQETALTLACCGGFLEIAELLINAGANLELGCSTPLMEAAQEGHVDLVKFLIASGLSSVNGQFLLSSTASVCEMFCFRFYIESRQLVKSVPQSSILGS